MSDSTLTTFEREVMEALLDGNNPILSTLRAQFEVAKVTKREITGAGFFVNFSVPTDALRVSGSFEIGDVTAQIESIKHGVGFLLFVRDGTLAMLEGFTYDESWPQQITNFKLSHINSQRKLSVEACGKIL